MEPHYTDPYSSVKDLLEKITNGLEVSPAILACNVGHSKRLSFSEYVRSVMDESGLNSYRVEQRSREEAERRGLDVKSYMISDAKVADIINDVPGNHQMSKLFGLAWAINRPIEEVAAYAFGFVHRLPEFQKSEVFRLWDLQQRLSGDSAKYFAQRIADLRREMGDALIKKQKR